MGRASSRDPSDHLPAIRRRLLNWYSRCQRDLPWRRRSGDAYAQWVAEMMLQQTQATTVIPYYERFLARFPTVHALADASREEVLSIWAGLGYYRRAHHLHDAARQIVAERGGEFPEAVDDLLRLPGIGRYTAGAIASIAFGRRAPILDGNVSRVVSRLFGLRGDGDTPASKARLWQLAEDLLPRRSCGEFNQALMDLGAVVCTPRQPACQSCPLDEICIARHRNLVSAIPARRAGRPPGPLSVYVFIVSAGDEVLLRCRPPSGLWSGMWELPSVDRNGGEAEEAAREVLPLFVQRRMGPVEPIGSVRHRLTHRLVRLCAYRCRAVRTRPTRGFRWVKPSRELPLPTAFMKVLDLYLAQAESDGHNSRQR